MEDNENKVIETMERPVITDPAESHSDVISAEKAAPAEEIAAPAAPPEVDIAPAETPLKPAEVKEMPVEVKEAPAEVKAAPVEEAVAADAASSDAASSDAVPAETTPAAEALPDAAASEASDTSAVSLDIDIADDFPDDFSDFIYYGEGAQAADARARAAQASAGAGQTDAGAPQSDYPPQGKHTAGTAKHASGSTAKKKKTSKKKTSKAAKERSYVSKTTLAVCMVLTMIVSSLLGAVCGRLAGGVDTYVPAPGDSDDSNSSPYSISEATDSELTVAQIVDKNENSVVEIVVSGLTQDMFGQSQLAEGAGSGVIFTEDGYIVTNYHVIEGANSIEVTLHNGSSYSAHLIGGDKDNDIAVIKINAKDLVPVEVGDSSKVDVGDLAVAIGNPLGQLGGTATSGIISALDRNLVIDGRSLNLIQTDAAINPGNSGGGLFNGSGQLIGIVDAKSSGADIEGLAFAIPINSVSGIIDDLITNGKASSKPAVGIVIADVSDENAEYYDLDGPGVYITQITGDNAKKAGFQERDKIISFNGEEIKDVNDFIAKVRACKIGDTVTVVVSRQGQQIEIKTVLEELNTND